MYVSQRLAAKADWPHPVLSLGPNSPTLPRYSEGQNRMVPSPQAEGKTSNENEIDIFNIFWNILLTQSQ